MRVLSPREKRKGTHYIMTMRKCNAHAFSSTIIALDIKSYITFVDDRLDDQLIKLFQDRVISI